MAAGLRHTTYLREPDIVPMAYWTVKSVRAGLMCPYQRMIAAKCKRQVPVFQVLADAVRNGLGHFRDESWVLDDAHWRVDVDIYVLKLMMSVKRHVPTESLQLLDETSLDEMNGTLIDTWFGLDR